jgi:hypothetical protein
LLTEGNHGTLVRSRKVVPPLKIKKLNPPLSSTTLINRFEGSCGTFGNGKKKPALSSTTLGQFVHQKKNSKNNLK